MPTDPQTTLHRLKEMVFPSKCPTCGWSQKQGLETVKMFETLLKIENVFSLQFIPMSRSQEPEMIDLNQQARERNAKVQELLGEWRKIQ